MKVGVYLRVSTDRQDEANQEPECLKTCEARGWQPVIYRERESATKRRPEWERLLEDARRGEIRGVVFYSISRIGRRRSQIADDLRSLARWGMAIVSVRERFLDVDQSPELARMREMLIEWWGWFAQIERDEIADRTQRAVDKVKRNIAGKGAHTSARSGRTITRLGRPGWDPRWKARALELGGTPGQIAKQLRAEGAPKIGRSTIRDWIVEKREQAPDAPAETPDDGPAARVAAG